MTTPRKHTLELYRDRAGEWRWNRKASNGRIVSDSGEGYVDRRDAIHGLRIANPDFRELRLTDDADNLTTTHDTDDEETPDPPGPHLCDTCGRHLPCRHCEPTEERP